MLWSVLMIGAADAMECSGSSFAAMTDCYARTVSLPELPAERVDLDVRVDDESRGAAVSILDTTPEVAASVLMDFDRAVDWFPDMDHSEVLAATPDGIRCAGVGEMPWPIGDRVFEMEMARVETRRDGQPVTLVTFRAEGDLDALYGYWLLAPLDDGRTLVEYVTNVDLGFWLPDSLVAWFTGHTLPQALDGLERAARSPRS